MKVQMSALALGLALAGCATPYQEAGLLGGVHAERIDETTLQISGKGNGYTSADAIQRYVIRKAAETTLADGYDLFLIVGSQDRTRHGVFYTPGSAQTTGQVTGYGNTAMYSSTTNYTAPMAIGITKPGETAIIKMFKGPKPADAPGNLYDAREVLKYMVPAPKAAPAQ